MDLSSEICRILSSQAQDLDKMYLLISYFDYSTVPSSTLSIKCRLQVKTSLVASHLNWSIFLCTQAQFQARPFLFDFYLDRRPLLTSTLSSQAQDPGQKFSFCLLLGLKSRNILPSARCRPELLFWSLIWIQFTRYLQCYVAMRQIQGGTSHLSLTWIQVLFHPAHYTAKCKIQARTSLLSLSFNKVTYYPPR